LNKVKLSLRLSQRQVDFLRAYGHTDTEALEKALDRLEEFEQHQHITGYKKKQEQLDILREKERIKTEALQERLKLRQKQRPTRAARVDWGEGYAGDSDSKYRDDWGFEGEA